MAHPATEFVETNGQRFETWTAGDPASPRFALAVLATSPVVPGHPPGEPPRGPAGKGLARETP